jgi:hypothetical protein
MNRHPCTQQWSTHAHGGLMHQHFILGEHDHRAPFPPVPDQITCSRLNCNRPRKHGRYCNPCYSLVRGTLMDPLERFWAKVDKHGPISEFAPHLGECWLWVGSISPQGYGKLTRNRRQMTAHRYAYQALVSPIANGLDVDHLCRVRHCVRSTHLEPVTRKENAQRGAKGRLVTSCLHGHAYDLANTYISRAGLRACRTCHREAVKAAKRRTRKGPA